MKTLFTEIHSIFRTMDGDKENVGSLLSSPWQLFYLLILLRSNQYHFQKQNYGHNFIQHNAFIHILRSQMHIIYQFAYSDWNLIDCIWWFENLLIYLCIQLMSINIHWNQLNQFFMNRYYYNIWNANSHLKCEIMFDQPNKSTDQ